MTAPNSDDVKHWLYQNIATILLTVTIGLSSFVWHDLVDTMQRMRTDIRALTSKINEVVTNQASQKEIIKNNREDIREMQDRLDENQQKWEDQWRYNNSPSNR